MTNINLIGGSGFLGKNFSKLLEINNIEYIDELSKADFSFTLRA